MSARVDKVIDEIVKMKSRIADYQTRLRDLERLKTELENEEIVSMVRGVDVAPDELRAFIEIYRKQKAKGTSSSARQEVSENEK